MARFGGVCLCALALTLWSAPCRPVNAAEPTAGDGEVEEQDKESDTPPTGAGSNAAIRPAIPPAPAQREVTFRPNGEKGVDWGGLFRNSGMFLGIQHAFRLAKEPGTREGMKGPFFKGWMEAATNLNGWGDGDEFYVNYVGHPIQGASAAYIWVQNDRSYRQAEFGKNALYWKSRLRATAFSMVYGAQFEIGPFSEASMGKIQARYPQQGVVDLLVTPFIGAVWMIAEDTLDQYVIKWFERKVQNPELRLLVRGWLNPTRSWANAMRLKVPWARDTRPGVYSPQLTSYLEDQRAGRIKSPQPPPVEREGVFGVATTEFSMDARPQVFGGAAATGCMGGGAELSFRMTRTTQFVLDFAGCKILGLETNLSGDTLSYQFGPRWMPRPSSRWSPFAHFLVGGTRITEERLYPALKAALTEAAKQQGKEPPAHEDYTTKYQSDGLTISAGSGLDVRLNPAVAIRVGSLEYKHSWLPPMNGRDFDNGLSFRTSIVLRMGTW